MPHGAAHPALSGRAEEAAEYFSAGRGIGPQPWLGDQECEQAQEAWPAAAAGRGQSRTWGGSDRRAGGQKVRDAHRFIASEGMRRPSNLQRLEGGIISKDIDDH